MDQIMVVDDNSRNGQEIESILMDRGYGVYVAEDPDEALEILERWSASLILSNVKRADMNADRFLREVRKQCPDARFIAMSRSPRRKHFPHLAFDGFLVRPFSKESLVDAVKRTLRTEQKTEM